MYGSVLSEKTQFNLWNYYEYDFVIFWTDGGLARFNVVYAKVGLSLYKQSTPADMRCC